MPRWRSWRRSVLILSTHLVLIDDRGFCDAGGSSLGGFEAVPTPFSFPEVGDCSPVVKGMSPFDNSFWLMRARETKSAVNASGIDRLLRVREREIRPMGKVGLLSAVAAEAKAGH